MADIPIGTAGYWVVLCQLMGGFRALPTDWPQYCNDLRQWADQLGRPPLPEQPVGLHHALWDARWNRQVWQYLAAFEPAGPAQQR